ncbi:hypothetical protein [Mycolicibacterium sp. P1-18]|uniref:hypothetical protein n=1 Tax=Mycolicibacterium sp. P1-18 TaxID=2024615 RepID=UPI0018DA12F1|nr:hypothetical protein [Mycolicibacterium sp. P1-18]
MVRIDSGAIELRHVLTAIAEYDRLGADAFMERYRFGRARTVFLTYSGRTYQAKAIVGVANGYATGIFVTGGDPDYKAGHAQSVLRRLGMDVIAEPTRSEMRRAPDVTSVLAVPIEANEVETFAVQSRMDVQERERSEGRIVTAYANYLRALGHSVCRHRITVSDGVLITDLYDETTDELVEAKSSTDRGTIRLALGQILDYARYIQPASTAILLPQRPSVDLCTLMLANCAGVVWPHGQVFERADPT